MSHASSNAGHSPVLFFLASVSFLNGSKPIPFEPCQNSHHLYGSKQSFYVLSYAII